MALSSQSSNTQFANWLIDAEYIGGQQNHGPVENFACGRKPVGGQDIMGIARVIGDAK